MTSQLRVLVEQPTRGKRWVAVAADWPGLERGGKTEDEAVEKLARYVPRYLPVAKRARLGSELETQTDLEIIGRYPGVGSTDFWGISFAPSPLDREPFDAPTFDRQVRLLRAAWAEFDETAARVSAELRPGVRGGGRSRDQIVRHVLANEGGDFSKRVKAKSELEDLLTPGGLAHHRDRFVEAMRAWYAEGKPLGNWTIPYLLRHTAYHALDHTWEMQDRDLTERRLRRLTNGVSGRPRPAPRRGRPRGPRRSRCRPTGGRGWGRRGRRRRHTARDARSATPPHRGWSHGSPAATPPGTPPSARRSRRPRMTAWTPTRSGRTREARSCSGSPGSPG